MTATTPAPTRTTNTTPIRATAKGHRKAGTDLTQPVMFFGFSADAPNADGVRYERVEMWGNVGFYGFKADGKSHSLGGVATKFWLAQAPAAVEPVAAPAASDDLDSMRFAQLMELAKAHKVPGRGTARIDALREGVRAARADAERSYASVFASA